MAARVEALSGDHNREAFDCGVPALNHFLQRTARQHQKKGVSQTFVLIDDELAWPTRILGYFALTACESPTEDLPTELARGLPQKIPAVLLGRLAVDRQFQGHGFGATLLVEAIRVVAQIIPKIGICGLFVDAKDDAAAAFYRHFGFVPLMSNTHRLFLPLESIRQIAGS